MESARVRIISCLLFEHNPWLVALAAFMCALGTTVAVRLWHLARRSSGRNGFDWYYLTGVALGATVWATHFIAMLGYQPGAPISFEPQFTLASVVIAIVGSIVALMFTAIPNRIMAIVLGGSGLGLSISAMHYVGMFAYQVEGVISWSLPYIVASIVISMAFGAAAVWAIGRDRSGFPLTILFVVLAIVSLHFTGMAAFAVEPIAGLPATFNSSAFNTMALAIGIVAMIIIGTGLVTTMIEQRTRAATETQLHHIATHDPLTGLANRRQFADRLASLTAGLSHADGAFALLMIDLDRFKPVNDSFGHPLGDAVLRRVARRIGAVVGDAGTLARLGGDEFAVLTRLASRRGKTAEQMAADIVEVVSRPFVIDGNIIEIGASVGVVKAPRHGLDADQLVQNADIALYSAKEAGRGTHCVFDPSMTEELQLRRAIEFDLRRATAREEFTLHYQAQVDATTGVITGAEALIRWHQPERGNVPPSVFIPIAEDLGLITTIGAWVLRRACLDAMTWPDNLTIAVNLSPVQLADSRFPELVMEVLAETGLPASRLELEITETAIIGNDEQALFALNQLRALGIAISLDDFGTGYSSLSYLHNFPINRIKIDRSFVQRIPNDADGMSIVSAIAQLGVSLGLEITAEGIETEEQQAYSAQFGCSHLQGYLISRPIEANDFSALVSASLTKVSAA